MKLNDLKALIQANFKPTPEVKFKDVESATRNGILEYLKVEELKDSTALKQNKPLVMALIEEVIDELLPEKLQDRVGDFAEIKQYARDAEVVFTIKGVGKRRAFLTIKKGQRGGLYQAARLDSKQMYLPIWTETVGVYVTLEEILLGKQSLQELMNNILDGFVERLYQQVIEALQAASNHVPDANKGAAAGIDTDQLDDIIRVISAYGKPTIMGFQSVISKINNLTSIDTANPNIPTSDLDEIKARGYVSMYKGGIPVVVLPNYIIDENTNDEWLLDESKLFVLPANEKPVKVALKGDLHIQEVPHPSGSIEQNAHKMLGVGILLYNNIGIYTDTDEE